jgi:hypothetical protein
MVEERLRPADLDPVMVGEGLGACDRDPVMVEEELRPADLDPVMVGEGLGACDRDPVMVEEELRPADLDPVTVEEALRALDREPVMVGDKDRELVDVGDIKRTPDLDIDTVAEVCLVGVVVGDTDIAILREAVALILLV